MTRRPVCADALNGDPACTRKPHGRDVYHSDGTRFWRYEPEPEPFVAEWLQRARDGRTSLARDETGRGL